MFDQNLVHGAGDRLSGLRELHAAFGADEKRFAQILFERLDLMAHGRLRQAQPLGRPGEIEGLGHGAERA